MIVNQRIIDLMDPKDREENLPKPIRLTSSERRAADEWKAELQMHDEFSKYLRLRRAVFAYVHANPVKRSTIRKGWPDFTVFCKIMLGPRPKTATALIEFKAVGGRISADQLQCFAELATAGIGVLVTTNLGDAINYLKEYFELPNEALL